MIGLGPVDVDPKAGGLEMAGNKWRASIMVGVGLVALAFCSVVAVPAATAASTVTIQGAVYCRNGNRVEGVWAQMDNGSSRWANFTRGATPSAATYSVPVKAPGKLELHIGCGTNPNGSWWSSNRTPRIQVTRNETRSVICNEKAGTGVTCDWWGSTIFVAMPFNGWFDRFKDATPPHCVVQSCLDWSTDLYVLNGGAIASTAVRPRIISPMTAPATTLRIAGVWKSPSNTGTQVTVDVVRGGNVVGTVKYGHLDRVPAFRVGQTITQSTVLGYLKRWPRHREFWDVTTNEGVHSHVEVGTPGAPKACWYKLSGTQIRDGQAIGKITPGSNATC